MCLLFGTIILKFLIGLKKNPIHSIITKHTFSIKFTLIMLKCIIRLNSLSAKA